MASSPASADHPVIRDQGATEPGQWRPKPPGVREVHNYSVKLPRRGDGTPRDWGYQATISVAGLLLVLLAAATMYVSFDAQRLYVAGFKTDDWAVVLEALSWDLAALSFAILALATALRGRSALGARVGNLLSVAVSVLMNLAQADLSDWGSILVWAGPPLLYAGVSDRIIVEIQHRMVERRGLAPGHTLWSVASLIFGVFWGVFLWLVRVLFHPKETIGQFRKWFLDEIPYAPGRTKAGDRAEAALAKARESDQVRRLALEEAAERVAAAERRAQEESEAARRAAEHEVERVRLEFAELQQKLTEDSARRETEQREHHRREREALEARLTELEQQSGTKVSTLRAQFNDKLSELRQQQQQELARERAHAEQERAELEQRFQAEVANARQATQERDRKLSALAEHNSALQAELTVMREAASSKQRMRWLYEQMRRQGDPRYGRRDCVREVAHELLEAAGMSPNSIGTAVGYLNSYLDELDEQRGSGVNGHALAGLS